MSTRKHYLPKLGESVLIQILFSALYTKLLEASKTETMESDGLPNSTDNQEQKSSICNVLAEAICSIDEDNKHTESITALINYARESQRSKGDLDDTGEGVGLSFVSTVKVKSYIELVTIDSKFKDRTFARWMTSTRVIIRHQALDQMRSTMLRMPITYRKCSSATY